MAAEIEKLQEDLDKRMPALNTLRACLKRLTHAQREQVVELEFEAQSLQDEIDQKTAFIQSVRDSSREQSVAMIEVNSEVFPGVELRLANRLTKVAKHMRGPITFKLADIGHGVQIVAQTARGNTVGMKTGKTNEPFLKITLPEIPPEPPTPPDAAPNPES